MKMKKRICINIYIMLLSVLLLSGCEAAPIAENDAEEYSEAIYTSEVVEDITQEENISFSEVILMDFISCDWQNDVGVIYNYLLLFEDGRVYYVNEKYRHGDVDRTFGNCDDAGWVNLEETYYLGRMSEEDLKEINALIENIMVDTEAIHYGMEPQYDFNTNGYSNNEILSGRKWNSMASFIVYTSDEGENVLFEVEGWYQENERKHLLFQTTDTNAIAVMLLVEESPFYSTWLELIFEGVE